MTNWHHVMSRGTAQWNIFLDDRDRSTFLRLVAKSTRDYRIKVAAYCLMGNHFHLLVHSDTPTLSEAVRDIKACHARFFNERHNRNGPLFRDRYKAKPVVDEHYFLGALRYIHRNPLDIDPTIDLVTYPWSSHAAYLEPSLAPSWLTTRLGLELTQPNYQSFVESPQPFDKIQNPTLVTVPGTVTKPPRSDWTIAEVIVAVAHAAHVSLVAVAPGARNGLIEVASLIALDYIGMNSEDVAEPLGYTSGSGVRMAAKRCRQGDDAHVASIINRSLKTLAIPSVA